jgi:acetyltransferase-like isoleucine patch superfamily enzyme
MIIERSRIPIKQIITIGLLPSPIKVWWYRLKGAKIGPGVKIGPGSVVIAKDKLEIGANTTIGMFSVVEGDTISIGKRVKIRSFAMVDARDIVIGSDVIISETAIIHTLIPSAKSRIVIHDRAHIFPFTIIDPSREVEIGEESSVGYATYIFTHGAYKSKIDGYPVDFGEVHIGKRVWIPCRIFIMPSVTIGDDAVIGTGALVTRDIPAGVLAVGEPAKAIKTKDQYVPVYSSDEKYSMLVDILNEFCEYLQDFAHFQWSCDNSNTYPVWKLSDQNRYFELDLQHAANGNESKRLSVVLGDFPDHVHENWVESKKEWFSIETGSCSEHLSDFGEELREFFRRYGLYFARP